MELLQHTDWRIACIGLALGLFGWTIYWAGLPLIGAIVGAGAGGSLAYVLTGFVDSRTAMWVILVTGLILGAVAGMGLIRAMQYYMFFIVGALLGGSLTWSGMEVFELHAHVAQWGVWAPILIVFIGALLGALILMRLRRFVIAIVTAFMGATLVDVAFPYIDAPLVFPIALAVFLAVQCGMVHRFVSDESFDRRTFNKLSEDQPKIDT